MADLQDIMYKVYEPKMNFRFLLELDGIDSFIVKSTSRPKINNGEVTISFVNGERYVKGKSKWEGIDLTIMDPIVPSGAQQVYAWIMAHHESSTNRDGYAEFYQRDITLKLLGPAGDVVEKWTLHRAFVTSADWQSLDYSSEDALNCNVSLKYDWAELHF